MGTHKAEAPLQHEDLFHNLAEQVKLPFVQIAHAAELLARTDLPADAQQWRQTIDVSAAGALRLIDGYLLSIELQRQGQLDLEPVSISSVLQDTADVLQPFARAHQCTLEVVIGGKYAPVMGHRRAIHAALTSLGHSFIEAATQTDEKAPRVLLAVRRTGSGIAAGVFTANQSLSSAMLTQARRFGGTMRQPLNGFESGSASGVFIADSLLGSLDTTMRTGRYKGLYGLTATFVPSRQLTLV